ncbi:MAG: hypothetical protein K5978_02730 [Campylobacter sp.]|nr:hypothetical protein [Campylobacter sp.]
MIKNLMVLLGIAVLFTAIWAIKDEKLSKKFKTILTLVLLGILLFAYIFESVQSGKSANSREILQNFNQGKIILCRDINVSQEKFNYEFGTGCFMPKREFKELNGLILPISECKKYE